MSNKYKKSFKERLAIFIAAILDIIITENFDHEPIFINLYKTFVKIEDDSVKRDICRTYYFFMIN